MLPISSSRFSPSKRDSISSKTIGFTQRFRCKTENAIQIINRHEQNKYKFYKTIKCANTKMMTQIESHNKKQHQADLEYFSIVEIKQLNIGQTLKVQLLPFTDNIYKIKNPFFNEKSSQEKAIQNKQAQSPLSNSSQQRNNEVKPEHEFAPEGQLKLPVLKSYASQQSVQKKSKKKINQLSNGLEPENNKNQAQLNKSPTKTIQQFIKINRSKQDKLKVYIKNYRGVPSELFVYMPDSQAHSKFGTYHSKYILNTQKIINIYLQEFKHMWVYIRVKTRSQLCLFSLRVDQEMFLETRKLRAEQLAASQQGQRSTSLGDQRKSQVKEKDKKTKNQQENSLNKRRAKTLQNSNVKLTRLDLNRRENQAFLSNTGVDKDEIDKTKIYNLRARHADEAQKVQGGAEASNMGERSFSLRLLKPTKIKIDKQQPLSPKYGQQSQFKSQKIIETATIEEAEKTTYDQKKKTNEEYKIKMEEVARKKEAIQMAGRIQSKLKSKALVMKRMLEQYKNIKIQEQRRIAQITPKIAIMCILPRFNKIVSQCIIQRKKNLIMAKKTKTQVKKFTKILKKTKRQNEELIPSFQHRQMNTVIGLTSLLSGLLYNENYKNAQKAVFSGINDNSSGLRVNLIFQRATKFRRSVRFVQKAWLSKHRAKLAMFKMYIQDQVRSLLKKYPHFQNVYPKFQAQNAAHTLSYKYMKDESSKVKYLFLQYRDKMQEIRQFEEMNAKIIQFNKTSLKKKKKQLLQVPKKPCFPTDRYFRNISFLKSIVRGWFQLEYRKWSKSIKFNQSLNKQQKIQSTSKKRKSHSKKKQ